MKIHTRLVVLYSHRLERKKSSHSPFWCGRAVIPSIGEDSQSEYAPKSQNGRAPDIYDPPWSFLRPPSLFIPRQNNIHSALIKYYDSPKLSIVQPFS